MKAAGNIIFCGVGGQGILLASEITADAFMGAGLDVKRSEVHGMAQRGGAVIAHLRYGDRVFSPLIDLGTADILVSFEMLEALRHVQYLHSGSSVIVNTQKIPPSPVATGLEAYPEDIVRELESRGLRVHPVDAFAIGRDLGEIRAVNLVLVGALSAFLPVEETAFIDAVRTRVKDRFVDVNIRAFRRGRELIAGGSGAPVQVTGK